MWASNDRENRWKEVSFKLQPVDTVEIYQAARRMQAEEFAKLVRKLGRGIAKLLNAVLMPYRVWREYQETYRELSALDDRMLADIGITRADIPRVAAGLWVPENRAAQVVQQCPVPQRSANVNRPQVAA